MRISKDVEVNSWEIWVQFGQGRKVNFNKLERQKFR